MTCDELLELLVDFIGGELIAEHRETVEIHISGCPHCSAYVATYTHTVRFARALPRPERLPAELEARLRKALEPELGRGDSAP
jgi:anti-sigma factor RsiW